MIVPKGKPILKFIVGITGMERAADQKEFSKFLSEENLNANQIDFVNSIVDYIVQNGSIEKDVLRRFPFNKNGGVIKLLESKMNVAKGIISVINKINERQIG